MIYVNSILENVRHIYVTNVGKYGQFHSASVTLKTLLFNALPRINTECNVQSTI